MPRRNVSKLRDGVMKRGATWSYVIRVKDTGTGISKPRWVGGYATEQEAKAARDEARVKACCCRECRSTSSPPAWVTPTRPSPSASTPTSSAPPRPPPRTSSPRP